MSDSDRPAFSAPAAILSKNTGAVSVKNEFPIQPSAISPVSSRFAGPSDAR